MIFQNNTVDMALLPKAEEVELIPIEKNYLKVLRIEWMIISVILIIAMGVLIFMMPSLQLFPAYLLMTALTILIIILYYLFQTLAFKKKGLWFKREGCYLPEWRYYSTDQYLSI